MKSTKMCDRKLLFAVAFVVLVCETCAKTAPSYIIPCKELTTECLTKTIQEDIPHFVKGVPELGLESLDPLKQKQIRLELPGGLKIELNDGSITGFRKCIVESAKYEPEHNVAELKLLCNITIRGNYKANGKILIVSLNGDGDAKVKATDVRIIGKIYFENEVRDGVTYYAVKKYTVNHKYDGKVQYQLTNLFKGNPEISKAVLLFLNENWRQLAEEFGDPIVNKVKQLVFDVISKFFKVIPKNELFA